MKNNKLKIFIISLLSLVAITASALFIISKTSEKGHIRLERIKNRIIQLFDKREHKICVFIHGSFQSGLGLLSIREVLKDEISGSRYEKAIRKLRNDKFFYQQQPILDQGLIQIKPSFTINNKEEKLAAHPILSAYKEIIETIKPKSEVNHFYTFGWSGILSQKERLKESLRLYNALCEKVEELRKVGINPKIQILTHSHGGNIALNLGAIHKTLEQNSSKKQNNQKTNDHLKYTIEYIENLPQKNKLTHKTFDYQPQNKNLKINELIMLGVPIQPENAHYIYNELFDKAYNFYSAQDIVQTADIFSTKEHRSKQRIKLDDKKAVHRSFQVKIMIDHPIEKLGEPKDKNKSWWEKLGQIFTKNSHNPSHKDLWFLAWNNDFTQKDFPLNPLPLVILMPFLTHAIEKTPNINDIDLNLCFDDKDLIKLYVVEHNKKKIKGEFYFPKKIIEKIKEKTLAWEPEDLSRHTSYKKLKHASSKTVTEPIKS